MAPCLHQGHCAANRQIPGASIRISCHHRLLLCRAVGASMMAHVVAGKGGRILNCSAFAREIDTLSRCRLMLEKVRQLHKWIEADHARTVSPKVRERIHIAVVEL